MQARLHPDHAAVTEADHAWLRAEVPFADRHSREAFLRERTPRWACWCYPTAGRTRIDGISRLYTLLFALDDRAVHDWDTYDGFLRMLDGTGDDTGPYAAAYKDVWSELTGTMPAGVRARQLRTQQRWAEALAMENAIRATGRTVHPDVCFPLRRISTGGETILVPIEYGLGIDLTPLLDEDADLAQLWQVAGAHLVLVNDLFSMRKEVVSGDGMNLMLSLMHHQDLDAQAAVDILVGRIRDAHYAYTRTSDLLRTRYRHHPLGDTVHRYLEAVGLMMAGNLAWHCESTRYHGPAHTWDGRPPTALVLHSDRTEFEYAQE
ncbi:terpene synthase family protein [Streptomyces sp. NPDC059010]|uniref:terpene synthase family protein n=1 Tax=Streptomyces sp. NPDC059010 TaxID=3346695 RepID=UPI00368CF5E2